MGSKYIQQQYCEISDQMKSHERSEMRWTRQGTGADISYSRTVSQPNAWVAVHSTASIIGVTVLINEAAGFPDVPTHLCQTVWRQFTEESHLNVITNFKKRINWGKLCYYDFNILTYILSQWRIKALEARASITVSITINKRSPASTAWRVLRLRMEERPPDVERSCQDIE